MDEEEAIDGLKRLGLTAYEARVFLGLQKLGNGTASEVSDVADVPRSQVYGAADSLEARGLVETQQSTPTVYRPVSLDRARTRLLDQLAETGAETFDYLDTVQGTKVPDDERSEAIWLVHGSESISSRAAELVADGDNQVFYAPSEVAMLDETALDALEAADEAGVSIVVASANPAVREAVAGRFSTIEIPPERDPDVGSARVLLVDEDTMLLGVYSEAGVAEDVEEVAFWSSETTFAAVLGGFLREWFTEPFGAGER
ncbi:TrmB family transcriptional regulator [Salinibaculum rarum]|uniref:TrmB family transcriptional regulator n=1 Tax=Salinibaculum rarum TaxID=3058903 RepID=UPI00265DA0BE|nr:helix-turn-helix domain-containing protein [Salinibaculum sp. KK48]